MVWPGHTFWRQSTPRFMRLSEIRPYPLGIMGIESVSKYGRALVPMFHRPGQNSVHRENGRRHNASRCPDDRLDKNESQAIS